MADPESRPSSRTRPEEGSPDEPSLITDARLITGKYLRFFRRYWLLFVGLPAGIAVGVALWTVSSPRLYRAQMTVAVARGSDQSAAIVPSFTPYLANAEILDDVLTEFKLDAPPFNLSRSVLLRDRYAVEPVRNTNLIRASLRLEDPQVAAAALARIAERASELVRRANTDLGHQSQQNLKAAYDGATKRLRELDAAIEEVKRSTQIDVLRQDVQRALRLRGTSGRLGPIAGDGKAKEFPLLAQLYDAERRLAELEERRAIAREIYREIGKSYELMLLRGAGAQTQLTVLDSPVTPDEPEPRGLVFRAIAGALLGLLLAMLAVVVAESGEAAPARRVEVI